MSTTTDAIDAAAEYATEQMRAGNLITAQELQVRYRLTTYGTEAAIRYAEDRTTPVITPAAKRTTAHGFGTLGLPVVSKHLRPMVSSAAVAARKCIEDADRWSAQVPRSKETR